MHAFKKNFDKKKTLKTEEEKKIETKVLAEYPKLTFNVCLFTFICLLKTAAV